MQREDRYLVIKRTDLAAIQDDLTDAAVETFNNITDMVMMHRDKQGKPPLSCVVVESDWPEYETTWKAIEKRVDAEQDG